VARDGEGSRGGVGQKGNNETHKGQNIQTGTGWQRTHHETQSLMHFAYIYIILLIRPSKLKYITFLQTPTGVTRWLNNSEVVKRWLNNNNKTMFLN
jgi:hypothetical protein